MVGRVIALQRVDHSFPLTYQHLTQLALGNRDEYAGQTLNTGREQAAQDVKELP